MGQTIVSEDGRFEWDEDKDRKNIAKHGFSFREILGVFDDPYLLERYDHIHSSPEEDRLIGIGSIGGVLIVLTCYTERGARTRIHSAWRAEPPEEREYYEQFKHFVI